MADFEIHEAVSDALRHVTVVMEQYIQAAGESVALHRTDLNALSYAMDATQAGSPLTPGGLAARMGLSPSATTSMLDRLEKAGHLVRSRDSADRRVVTITMTDRAAQTGYQIFVPLAQAFDRVMVTYRPADLSLVRRFLNEISAAIDHTRLADGEPTRDSATDSPSPDRPPSTRDVSTRSR